MTATFQDLPGDGLISDCYDCPATCDCLSPYIDGVDEVSPQIDTPGNLALGLGLPRHNQPQPIRMLFFDFSDCASDFAQDCTPPFESGLSGMTMFTSGVNLRAMNVGDVSEELSLSVTFKPSEEGSSWRLFFDPSDDRCLESTNITVTRVAADTWEIEAGPDDVACLLESGLYHMPFTFILQTK